MMNLIRHRRSHIPNTLAIFAIIMLLATSAVGLGGLQDTDPAGKSMAASTTVKTNDNKDLNSSVENKRRGLKLGLLLFRR